MTTFVTTEISTIYVNIFGRYSGLQEKNISFHGRPTYYVRDGRGTSADYRGGHEMYEETWIKIFTT